MIIDVSQQLRERVGSERRYSVSESGDPPLHGEVSLHRTGRGIFVRGTLETTLSVVCSRCLVAFGKTLALRIEDEFLSEAEGDAFTIDKQKEIDLYEAVRQYSLLAQPLKPLCRGDCAGLCPCCGHNLNLGPCGCPNGDIESGFITVESQACSGNRG